MGGHVFAKLLPPLPTPRMPPAVYSHVLNHALICLRQLFTHVESPIEAPGKDDYGDVDLLVCKPITPGIDQYPFESLMTSLGGIEFVSAHGTNTLHVAVEWPKELMCSELSEGLKYAQLDVNFISEYDQFKWDLFQQAHADIWSILGSILRRYGLTVNNQGLNIRIPEIEKLDKKKSLIQLTKEPADVLKFIGYEEDSIKKYWSGFKTAEEMFSFAIDCRFFCTKSNREAELVAQGGENGNVSTEKEGGEKFNSQDTEATTASDLKQQSNNKERRRLASRGLYRKWTEEYFPKAIEDGLYREQPYTREEVRDMAFERFGVAKQYQSRLDEWNLNIARLEEKREVKRRRKEEAESQQN